MGRVDCHETTISFFAQIYNWIHGRTIIYQPDALFLVRLGLQPFKNFGLGWHLLGGILLCNLSLFSCFAVNHEALDLSSMWILLMLWKLNIRWTARFCKVASSLLFLLRRIGRNQLTWEPGNEEEGNFLLPSSIYLNCFQLASCIFFGLRQFFFFIFFQFQVMMGSGTLSVEIPLDWLHMPLFSCCKCLLNCLPYASFICFNFL